MRLCLTTHSTEPSAKPQSSSLFSFYLISKLHTSTVHKLPHPSVLIYITAVYLLCTRRRNLSSYYSHCPLNSKTKSYVLYSWGTQWCAGQFNRLFHTERSCEDLLSPALNGALDNLAAQINFISLFLPKTIKRDSFRI